jgi:hypothetical protein
MPGLSFITLLAYDYRYSYMALRSYYDLADEIILGLDVDRLTWVQQPFEVDADELKTFIADIDHQGKIRIVEGNFHSAGHPMTNETVERCRLSEHAAPGNWVVQIDADEILLNGPEFRDWLLLNNPTQLDVDGRCHSVFKVFGHQVLVVQPPTEPVPVATMLRGQYIAARRTRQQRVMSPLQVLHFSWGRTSAELRQKLRNWGHAKDFDTQKFFDFWESITLDNFAQAKNFHPFEGPLWSSLTRAEINFLPGAPYVSAEKK